MLNTNPAEVSVSASTQWLKQMELFAALNTKALESMTQLAELNMQMMQDAMKNSSTIFQAAFSSEKTPATMEVQPAIDSALTYSRQVAAIALDMRSECARVAQENVATINQQMTTRFDDLVSNAPEGTKDVLGLMRMACNNANNGCEQLLKTSEKTVHDLAVSLNDGVRRFTAGSAKTGKNAHVQ